MSAIGAGARHVDWAAITSGSATYADDITLPHQLVGAVLRSPHAHARIVSVDTARARAIPGVRAVLTADDVPDKPYLDYRPVDADRRILAKEVVRHIGEPIALIAADDEETATRALAAIRVRYRRLPVLDTMAKARRPGAPAIHRGCPGNVAYEIHRSFGEAPEARSRTRHTVRSRYRSTRQTHATMEPHTVLAHWRPDEGCLHVWAPSQNPRLLHRDLAQLFGLELHSVRMHEIAVGGDFGGRTQISSTEALVCALSLATERPVKLRQSRSEEFAFTKWRLSWDTEVELGCDAVGAVTYLQANFDVDNGAYNQAGPGEMIYGSIALGSSYRWMSYDSDGSCVYTNKSSASSFRGAGGYAVNWTLECAIDELAEKAGIDPIDFRLQNMVSEVGDESITGWKIKSSALRDCLAAVRREIDWDRKRAQGGRGSGVGVACVVHVTALSRDYMLRSRAALDISPDGHVTVRSGCGDAGTGQKTLLCQTVGEVLGIEPGEISIVTTDTGLTPHDAGAGASRGSFVSVSTVKKLAEEVRDTLRAAAAEKFHADPAGVSWGAGRAEWGNEAIEIGDLAVLAAPTADTFSLEVEFTGDSREAASDGFEDIAPTYSFAAHAVEVDVDENTGAVHVRKIVAAHDSGTILNPTSARGQVEGGAIMGLGAVLGESLIFEGGRVVNPSYVDYVIPRAADTPEIETIFVPSEDEVGPFGAKGLGEIPLLAVGPAVTNAISHAIGVRLTEAPHTPDQVLRAIRARDGLSQRAGSLGRDPKRWWVEAMRRAYAYGAKAVLTRLAALLPTSPAAVPITGIARPRSLEHALREMASRPAPAPMGGGTDILALQAQGLPNPPVLVELTTVPDLTRVTVGDGGVTIGAAVSLAQLAREPRVGAALRSTVEQIATPQIREAATVAGNLCQTKRCWFFRNGFDCYKRGGPARPCYAVLGDHRFYHAVEGGHRCQAVTPSDLATTLVALDAQAEIAARGTRRSMSVERLYTGPGEVNLAPGEMITAIHLATSALDRRTVYRKFSLWQGAFAVFTICVSASLGDDGSARDVRIVLGGVGPTPRRQHLAEAELEGARPTIAALDRCVATWLKQTHPLDDNHWKAFAAGNILRSALIELFGIEGS